MNVSFVKPIGAEKIVAARINRAFGKLATGGEKDKKK